MTSMILSSFYNTLINKEESIEASTIIEIDRLRRNNKLFTILTNRTYQEILYYNKDFPFIDYIVSLNGSIIYDVNKNKIIYKNSLSKEIINRVKELFPNKKIIYYLKDKEKEDIDNDKVYKIEIEINKNERDLINILGNNINKSIFNYNNKYYIEITNKSIIHSIEELIKKERINKNEIIAIIGNDSEKDITNIINKTYVVSNGTKSLKKSTKYKTKSNEERGVEQVLKTI